MDTYTSEAIIFAILTTGAVLIAIQISRLWRASMQHKTIREAISRDNASVDALLASLGEERERPSGTNDDRNGGILIAIGLAMFLYSIIDGSENSIRELGGAAVFPLLIGGALLLRYYLARRRDRQA